MTDKLLLDIGPATSPPQRPARREPPPRDPLSVACPYPGSRYAAPCRALPGQPCCDGHGLPRKAGEHHAERRAAAGEKVHSYEEIYGRDAPARVDEEAASHEGPAETEPER